MELPAAAVTSLLETWPVAILATLAPGGRPHQVPVVFARHGEYLWSPVDGKPKASRPLARLRHVEGDPRVGLLLEHYDADWRHLWWVRVDGEAAIVRAADEACFDDVSAALHRKYPQYDGTALFAGDPTLIRVDPQRLRSWCAGPDALP